MLNKWKKKDMPNVTFKNYKIPMPLILTWQFIWISPMFKN